MNIIFTPDQTYYGRIRHKKVSTTTVDVSSMKQYIACIDDGYLPAMSFSDVKEFMRKIICGDNSGISNNVINSIIEVIEQYYNVTVDFFENDAIFVFNKFIQDHVLDLNYKYKRREFV